jgi:predicted RNase H-like HicB family nuclease
VILERHDIGLIHRTADSDDGVSFPDLPGCVTAGATLDEAREMAAEALALYLGGMAEDGDSPREPSSLEAIMANNENKDRVAILLEAPPRAAKSVRVNITPRTTFSPRSTATPKRRGSRARGCSRSLRRSDGGLRRPHI